VASASFGVGSYLLFRYLFDFADSSFVQTFLRRGVSGLGGKRSRLDTLDLHEVGLGSSMIIRVRSHVVRKAKNTSFFIGVGSRSE